MSPIQNLNDITDFGEFKSAILARLQNKAGIGPVFDPRTEFGPQIWLVSQYQEGESRIRDWMKRAVESFLEEINDQSVWDDTARNNLLYLSAKCRLGNEVVNRLIRDTGHPHGIDGINIYSSLLKCSLNQGNRWTPEFWDRQLEILGPEYGALAFRGLLEHGLEIAMERLETCSSSDTALAGILYLLPMMVEKHGFIQAKNIIKRYSGRLTSATASSLHRALAILDPKMVNNANNWNGDSVPNHFDDSILALSLSRPKQLNLHEIKEPRIDIAGSPVSGTPAYRDYHFYRHGEDCKSNAATG